LLIFLVQATAISFLAITDNLILLTLPLKAIILGPLYILLAAICEFIYFRTLKKHIKNNTKQNTKLIYLVAFTEISFPATVILLVISIVHNHPIMPIPELLNSPPFIMYFILIILSSLNLNKKLSAFTGLIAGLQYTGLCLYLKSRYDIDGLFIPNVIIKSALMFVCGLVAGFVSEKIKEALLEALHAQDKLINQLDKMVKDKTKEITLQKQEIEHQHAELQDKNKEIIDSIHYAKRIQKALMPNEKYFEKNLKVKGK